MIIIFYLFFIKQKIMFNLSLYNFIMYLCVYLFIMMIGFIFGLFVYYSYTDNNKQQLPISSSKNDEIMKVIKTMKKDLIINIDKYSFIEINDIINIIIDILIKNKCEYNDEDDINRFIENKREIIINEIKIHLLINYKNELINKIIMEKNILNTTLKINDLTNIKTNIIEHKKEINNLFELVNEINIIDIRITID
jgi:hypothetical protein